ncbi:MAG: hypothetical protein ACRDS9_09385, partial [Pseudonocardiaceae bacterium]
MTTDAPAPARLSSPAALARRLQPQEANGELPGTAPAGPFRPATAPWLLSASAKSPGRLAAANPDHPTTPALADSASSLAATASS